jgi:hypothetical protein
VLCLICVWICAASLLLATLSVTERSERATATLGWFGLVWWHPASRLGLAQMVARPPAVWQECCHVARVVRWDRHVNF